MKSKSLKSDVKSTSDFDLQRELNRKLHLYSEAFQLQEVSVKKGVVWIVLVARLSDDFFKTARFSVRSLIEDVILRSILTEVRKFQKEFYREEGRQEIRDAMKNILKIEECKHVTS